MNTTKSEKTIKELFIGNCWEYLRDNFHKFNETNKIKIALELCKKDLPTQVIGEVKVTEMPAVKTGNRLTGLMPLEIDVGEPDIRNS